MSERICTRVLVSADIGKNLKLIAAQEDTNVTSLVEKLSERYIRDYVLQQEVMRK